MKAVQTLHGQNDERLERILTHFRAGIDVPGQRGIDSAGSFDGTHIYADNGLFTVTATVWDDDGGADTHYLQLVDSRARRLRPTLHASRE